MPTKAVIGRPSRRSRWIAVASVLLFSAAVATLYATAVRSARGQALDNAALAGHELQLGSSEQLASHVLQAVPDVALAILALLVVSLALLRSHFRVALFTAVALVGAAATAVALKALLPRPRLVDIGGQITLNSYPSGHATIAMALALALTLVVPGRYRMTTGIVGAVFTTIIGLATITAAWHRMSDALGGFLVAMAWFAGAAAVLGEGQSRNEADLSSRPRFRVGIGLLILGSLSLGMVGIALLASVAPDIWRGSSDQVLLRSAFGGSQLLVYGAVWLLTAWWLLLVDDPPHTRG